jgi:hypothetical protein
MIVVVRPDMAPKFVEVVGAAIVLPSTADGCKRETRFDKSHLSHNVVGALDRVELASLE